MSDYDHHVLIIVTKPGHEIRYSRCPRGFSDMERFAYYDKQVRETLPIGILEFVIEDKDHTHPEVTIWRGVLKGEHMP
jgi:hypothetical protein